MNQLQSLILSFHFIGLAAIITPFAYQLKSNAKKHTTKIQWYGALLSLATGLLLGAGHSLDLININFNHIKVAAKFIATSLILVLTRKGLTKKHWPLGWIATGCLAIMNTTFALIW